MGKRHLETAASSFNEEAVVKIEWLPYTLIEEGSQYDGMPLLSFLEERYGKQAALNAADGSSHLAAIGHQLVS